MSQRKETSHERRGDKALLKGTRHKTKSGVGVTPNGAREVPTFDRNKDRLPHGLPKVKTGGPVRKDYVYPDKDSDEGTAEYDDNGGTEGAEPELEPGNRSQALAHIGLPPYPSCSLLIHLLGMPQPSDWPAEWHANLCLDMKELDHLIQISHFIPNWMPKSPNKYVGFVFPCIFPIAHKYFQHTWPLQWLSMGDQIDEWMEEKVSAYMIMVRGVADEIEQPMGNPSFVFAVQILGNIRREGP
ncbi:hypothetical protein EDD17DRAFT_1505229 [Pisolithus thermaeus]|nr:hypothetical protein EDD17DRAFT_1505229 [Pisolithus thermaeus]